MQPDANGQRPAPIVLDVATQPQGASVASQLSAWHGQRGNKSFVRAMVPSPKQHLEYGDEPTKNPIKLLASLSPFAWLMLFSGWFAWTCDGYDFFCVSLSVAGLSESFAVTTKQITFALTLTLLFRSLGALIFGILADRYGRKWTLTGNLLFVAVFELGSAFCQTYEQFLAVRSMFGIGMGGIWGSAATTALENMPVPARGLCSGFLQQGISVGYLLAAVVNLGVVPKVSIGWRVLYLIGAGLSVLAAAVRAVLPESEAFILARQEAKTAGVSTKEASKSFFREVGSMMRSNWLRWIWAICIMTGFNFLSHGSQDLYPTYLQVTKGVSPFNASQTTIVSNCGAIIGGTIAGYASQYLGRRLCLLLVLCYTAAWIPLWILPSSHPALNAGGFLIQSGVQGAWGLVPIYLGEISPPAFRASFAGLAYQLGNMASSGAAQIEAAAGETVKLPGTKIPDYATIQAIMVGAVLCWMILCTILGPESDGAHFEQARVAFQTGAGAAKGDALIAGGRDGEAVDDMDKPNALHVERV